MITYPEFGEILSSAPNCARFELTFGKAKYVITKYEDYIAFSPFVTDAKEEYFSSLDELNRKKLFSGMCFADYWIYLTSAVAVSTYNLCSNKEKSQYFSFISENKSISLDTVSDGFSDMSDGEKKSNLYFRQKQTLDRFLERGAISRGQYETSLNELNKILK